VLPRLAGGDSVNELATDYPDIHPAAGRVKLWIDEDLSPSLVEVRHEAGYQATSVRDRGKLSTKDHALAAGWGARGKAAKRLRATIGLALDFLAWRTLHKRGLGRTEAIAVMSSRSVP
jgi:hypothetical protein